MSPILTVLAVLVPGVLLAFLLHRLSRWTDATVDEEYAQLDEQLDVERDYLRWVKSLPTLPFDAERLGS